MNVFIPQRRRFIRQMTGGMIAAFATPGAFAEALLQTPQQGEGPFYPNKLPLDTDNDLILINDSLTPAVGEITYLSGNIVNPSGTPVRGATVEIWQCDSNGVYLHSGSDNVKKRETNFQGFGRFITGSNGAYLFRTIKPVPYTGRTPHIHFKIKARGKELLTTQCYIKDHPENAGDGLWNSVRDEKIRDLINIDFIPIKGAAAGELHATFNIVLGVSPEH